MEYRSLLDQVRVRVPARKYPIRASIDGDVPPWLRERLPLFSCGDGEPYVSSGGRSLIVEGEGETYRIKGADPLGTMTETVARSEKALIADVVKSAAQVPSETYRTRLRRALETGEKVEVPPYGDKPFNFLTFQNTENSKAAFDALGEAYDKKGYVLPCRYAGRVIHPQFTWRGSMLYSLVFRLPDAESDLREVEFERLLKPHLNHATPEQLRGLQEEIAGVFEGFLKWHAFDCRILTDNHLAPSPDSFLGQNHVIGRVGGGLGLTRVDHTSTTHRPDAEREGLRKYVSDFFSSLFMFPYCVVQALEMREKGDYDRERYSGWFDAAYKFSGSLAQEDFPRTLGFFRESRDAFDRAFEEADPQPVSEERLLRLVEQVREIKIDEGFERRRQERYQRTREELAALGMTPEDAVKHLVQHKPRLG